MGRLFGTDGIRGRANEGDMTPESALQTGRALAVFCLDRRPGAGRLKIIIGRDTRRSGPMLESALAAGICSMGVDVLLAGEIPTPAVAFLARDLAAAAGVAISASHNPYYDNGIKIFLGDGFKLSDAEEARIERLVMEADLGGHRATGADIGIIEVLSDATARYAAFCRQTVPATGFFNGLKVVLDCANGATCRAAPAVFEALGAEVVRLHDNPDGTNINDNCGSQHTQDARAAVVAEGAALGLAFDGDGDRLIAVDEMGNELTGDQIIAIIAERYKHEDRLADNRAVVTVMSNCGFHAAMKRLGIEVGVAAVGDRQVVQLMRESGAVVGGEDSGHVVLLDLHTTGDGILTALHLARIVCESGRPLSEIAQVMEVFPQKLVNVDVKQKPPVETIVKLRQAIEEAEAELGADGRVLVRYSGTQPMCRVMVEGPTAEITERLAARLATVVKECIG